MTKASAKMRPKTKAPSKKASSKKASSKKASSKKGTAKHSAPKRRAEKVPAIEKLLAPTALVLAQEELEILLHVVKHPALGPAAVERWQRRTTAGIPKRDLPAFREAVAKVDVDARVRTVVRKLERAWRCKLDSDTMADVRGDIEAMYRGE